MEQDGGLLTEAETSLIGSVLIRGRDVLEEVNIKPADFSSLKHELTWKLFLSMHHAGQQIDLVTTNAALQSADDTTRRNVSPVWLHETMAGTPTAANATYYADIVTTGATRRKLTAAATRIAQAAVDMPPADLIDFARAEIDQAADITVNGLQPMSEHVAETIEDMKTTPTFKSTPWQSLNDVIGGFRPGAMYVVGARPGAGKTIVGLQAALEMTKHGAVLFATLEMGRAEMHKRVFAQQALIPLERLVNSDLTSEEWAKLDALNHGSWSRLYIEDSSAQTAESIRMRARTIARQQPLACVVVDYLQLMEGTAGRGVKRQELVAQWSRKLKLMAKSLNVPVIALSQLNRESDRGEPPKLSDLRESGAIEQDADVVMLMQRDDKLGELKMLVAKNRHGPRMNLSLNWWGGYSMLTDPWVRTPAQLGAA